MKTTKITFKVSKVIAMSADTREKIIVIGNSLKGKELFIQKVEEAKKSLNDLKSLPI